MISENKLTWQAREFEKHEKSAAWFVALWILVAGLAAVAVIMKAWLMIPVVLIGAILISIYAVKEPRMVTFILTENNLHVEQRIYSLGRFASFWIFEEEEHDILSLAPRHYFQPHFKIPLPKEYSSDARLLLRPRLEEEEHKESFIDALSDRLGF
jgi:hypothetical protein